MKSSTCVFITSLLLPVFCITMLVVFLPQELAAEKEKKEKDKKQTSAKNEQVITDPTETKYTGQRGDFIFHEAELKNVLLFFSKTYKFNILIDPDVSGKVTCRLINVPWDQAMDLILKQHGLAAVWSKSGNVVYPVQLKKFQPSKKK
jgi:type IV pilus assembly protein PilQ